jgi:hypothetical protein
MSRMYRVGDCMEIVNSFATIWLHANIFCQTAKLQMMEGLGWSLMHRCFETSAAAGCMLHVDSSHDARTTHNHFSVVDSTC